MPTAALKTLGCKLNQYESEQMREQLARLGYSIVPFDGPADLYIVNSCTVTSRTDRDARRLARRARRFNPDAFIIVTGCYAQVAPEEVAAIAGVDLVCDNREKLNLAAVLPARLIGDAAFEASQSCGEASPFGAPISAFAAHTRSFVKVQEGCNARCTYCIIPRARGGARSVPLDEVLDQAKCLGDAGYPEIVLIGTHLGQYGVDLEADITLTELVRRVCDLPAVRRVRLSSLEPCEIPPELIAMVAAGGAALHNPAPEAKLCRHLHIPLQSGSKSVLERMNRPYDPDFYMQLIRDIHAASSDIALGADVIVGFPGETDEEFAQTHALLETLPLAYLHVFTYSPRRGTPAAEMPDQVNHEIKIARNHILRELSERKRCAFAKKMIGQSLEVVLQGEDNTAEGLITGITDTYLEIRATAPSPVTDSLVRCRITGTEEAVLFGAVEQ